MIRLSALVLALLLGASANGAEPPAGRSVLALIVTNNRSAQLGRPDLRYADDDGAKYYELFRMLAPAEQVTLLTDLDPDTARLFPKLVAIAKPPSRAQVVQATEALARQVDGLRTQGHPTDFYFIYAGHGDIDQGRGFIELSDAAVNADDLDALIFRRIHATNTHIILDSCNSFFVLNPRKPGGRRFPSSQEAAEAIAARLPNVGVFLSTSAEAQVYEWSELQSGIFSHAVRSGLTGAADVDGDGRVSYTELAAFVNLAAKDVRNPLYRPTVFARGPGGRNDSPMIDLATANAATLELPAGEERRITVRDGDDLPWIDLHTEADNAVRLRLPEKVREQLTVDSRSLDASGRLVVRREGVASVDHPTLLAQLATRAASENARGPSDLFRALFSQPFGPHALAAYLADASTTSAPPIGIAQEDIARMRLLLRHTAEIDRARRLAGAAITFGLGGLSAGLGSWIVATRSDLGTQTVEWSVGVALVATAGMDCLLGTILALRRSNGERISSEFEAEIANPKVDQQQLVARTEQRLFRLYQDERHSRRMGFVLGWAVSAVGTLGLALSAIPSDTKTNASSIIAVRGAFALVTVLGLANGIESSFETPIERMVRLWSEDPGIQRIPRVGVTPASAGPALSLSGRF